MNRSNFKVNIGSGITHVQHEYLFRWRRKMNSFNEKRFMNFYPKNIKRVKKYIKHAFDKKTSKILIRIDKRVEIETDKGELGAKFRMLSSLTSQAVLRKLKSSQRRQILTWFDFFWTCSSRIRARQSASLMRFVLQLQSPLMLQMPGLSRTFPDRATSNV